MRLGGLLSWGWQLLVAVLVGWFGWGWVACFLLRFGLGPSWLGWVLDMYGFVLLKIPCLR